MHRREFLQVCSATGTAAFARSGQGAGTGIAGSRQKTLLFWDTWFLEHQDNVELCPGRATWRQEATYEDPYLDNQFAWTTVYRAPDNGQWRMLYTGSIRPLTVMGAESDDGLHWRPMNRPDIQPPGAKFSPNHLFTIEAADGGPIYIDPRAADGLRFKLYCTQYEGPASARALANPKSAFHELVKREGPKAYVSEQVVATSADGLHWQIDPEANWGSPPWYAPDSPMTCHYSEQLQRHVMLLRPRKNDRRLSLQTSADAMKWSERHVCMQPDPLDPPQIQFYGMAVTPYESDYAGFLYVFHNSSSIRTTNLNEMTGTMECQLCYSLNGLFFQRGFRTPFVPLNEPGLPGSAMVYPTCMVEAGDELRIYSAASKHLHFGYPSKNAPIPKGQIPATAITVHTLRKDGFTYLASKGNWGVVTTKGLVVGPEPLHINAQAPYGELRCQVAGLDGRPLQGFTFDDCVPFREQDSLRWEPHWRQRQLTQISGQPVRLQLLMRNARVYAIRGDIHFLDMQDVDMIRDGKPIDTTHLAF